MLRIFLICFVFAICFQLTPGQDRNSPFPLKPVEQIKPPYCEYNLRKLYDLADKIGANDILIIVSHLGKAEKAAFGPRRLYNAKTYLTTTDTLPRVRPADSVITVQGDAVDGNGFLDFYVKGQLELRVYINKNADFSVTSCIVDPPGSNLCTSSYERPYYPCKAKTK
jgi:hypothetical protein